MNFLYLLKAENGLISPDLKHYTPHYACDNTQGITVQASNCQAGKKGFYWKLHHDWGFCGISDSYKGNIKRDPRFFTDWKWQMRQCLNEWKQGTTFYGWRHFQTDSVFRAAIKNSFTL